MEFSLVSCVSQLLDKLYLYLNTQTFHVCQIGSLSPRVCSGCCMSSYDHNKLRFVDYESIVNAVKLVGSAFVNLLRMDKKYVFF